MKLVAVSQRVDVWAQRNESRDALDQKMNEFLQKCGFAAVPVPNTANSDHLISFLKLLSPTGIVLSGGNEIGEVSIRDSTERVLLDYAEYKQLPVLGVCRGMQFMGYRDGMKLAAVEGHVSTRHKLFGEINHEVNSYHRFSLLECPKSFLVTAESEDKKIEGIRHQYLDWEGWMWHPEREKGFNSNDIQRLKSLFEE